MHKKNTTIIYSTSISKKFQLQEPLQTTHSRTITAQIQHILNLFRTSDNEQLQLLPAATHSRTTYCKSTVPAPRILHKTIPTDTRTPHTASTLHLHKTISTDTTTTTTITPDSCIHRTIPTVTRIPHTTSMLFTSPTPASATTLHCMK